MPRMKMQKVVPLGYAPVLALEGYARSHNDKRTYELVKIRASKINRCGFCIAMHTRDARKIGETDDRIAALDGKWHEQDLWTPAEAAALYLTDQVTRLGEEGVTDEVWDEAIAQWGAKGTANLVIAIATINVWNRIGIATGLEAEDL